MFSRIVFVLFITIVRLSLPILILVIRLMLLLMLILVIIIHTIIFRSFVILKTTVRMNTLASRLCYVC